MLRVDEIGRFYLKTKGFFIGCENYQDDSWTMWRFTLEVSNIFSN
jgi:hypothetical protein